MPVNGLDIETHSYLVEGTTFEVDKRYQIVEALGHGAYGIVCEALDLVTEESVAVKKIEGVFEHITITKRALRELRILRHLQHENLVQIKSVFSPSSKANIEDIYVVSELMETDLGTTLKSSQELTDTHYQFFLYQILCGMKYVHSANVIHRDLKPRNLLVNSNCDLKICDFGLARVHFCDSSWVCPMTEYVCTRWYRAPEVLCSWTDYSAAIDIWSIGCILAELLTRKPLFPGQSTQQQLDLIITLMGKPGADALTKIPNEKCRKFISSLPEKDEKSTFPAKFSEFDAMAQDFLLKTLCWDPEKRLTVPQAITQPYVEQFHCEEDELTREPLDTSDFEFERRKITFDALREEIFREAMQYYPELQSEELQSGPKGGGGYDVRQFPLFVPGESQYSSEESVESPRTPKTPSTESPKTPPVPVAESI